MKACQFISTLLLTILITACSEINESSDYRIPFTGDYECIKQPNNIYLPDIIVDVEVRIDSQSDDKIYVGTDLVPISESGTYGPDLLRSDYHYELVFRNDSIFIRSHINFPNGIVAPSILTGSKRE